MELPELNYNPFRFRIGQVFGDFDERLAGAQAGNEGQAKSVFKLALEAFNVQAYKCTFMNFLHIMHVFSPR